MSTETTTDLEVLCNAVSLGMPVDPRLKARVKERAEKVREEIFKRQGYLNVAVDLIRDARE